LGGRGCVTRQVVSSGNPDTEFRRAGGAGSVASAASPGRYPCPAPLHSPCASPSPGSAGPTRRLTWPAHSVCPPAPSAGCCGSSGTPGATPRRWPRGTPPAARARPIATPSGPLRWLCGTSTRGGGPAASASSWAGSARANHSRPSGPCNAGCRADGRPRLVAPRLAATSGPNARTVAGRWTRPSN
jgi:hypothetical protein